MRQILLHLLQPGNFERISSGTHKRLIAEAFDEFVPADDADLDDDDRLLLIRSALEGLEIAGEWPDGYLDFYWPPLVGIWRVEGDRGGDGSDSVSLVEALEWWKQAILYGPPGTSETYRIREVAGVLIRRALLREWGAQKTSATLDEVEKLAEGRVEWTQLHPAFGYEEFVRGLRIRDGNTTYEPGLLLARIDELDKEPEEDRHAIPWVLVLDEINRTDLSRMLGEAFSRLEPSMRGQSARLPGREGGVAEDIVMPENLFVIGTMNLIDQSVEQIDFAMRRRFHWHPCRFDRQLVIDIVQRRLAEYGTPAKHRDRPQLNEGARSVRGSSSRSQHEDPRDG